MGYDARNDQIRDNVERMRGEREAYADALAIVRQINTRLSTSVVLADDCCTANVETSLVSDSLRQLWDCGRFGHPSIRETTHERALAAIARPNHQAISATAPIVCIGRPVLGR